MLLAYVWVNGHNKKRKLILTISLVVGLSLVSLFPKLLKIDTMSSASAGFVWEIVTAIQHMDEEKQQEYIGYFDDIGGEGSTASALSNNRDISVGGIMESELSANVFNKEASGIILRKYFGFIVREPTDYFDMKSDFIKRTLGIGRKLDVVEWDYNRWDVMGIRGFNGFNDCNQRRAFLESYQKVNEKLGFYTCQPWLVFLISFLLVAVSKAVRDEKSGIYLFVLLLGIFYYGAFIINTQAFEIRYFYPSLYLMMILNVAIIISLFGKMIRVCKNEVLDEGKGFGGV